MNLIPLTERSEIAAAFKRLRARMTVDAIPFTRTIGFRGGNVKGKVLWRRSEQFWFYMDPDGIENRYWCCYGLEDVTKVDMLSITTEINPPRESFNRMISGAFLTDGVGSVFLAHSGKIGGGKPGIGKQSFLDSCPGLRMSTVNWPDEKQTEMVLIARIDDLHLPQQIHAFVKEVDLFKKGTTFQTPTSIAARLKAAFNPEFEGARRPYRTSKAITSYCDHGVVVRTLKDLLASKGLSLHNDRYRDLFALNREGQASILIEIKTSFGLSDIYSGTGQLMINGAQQDPRLIRILTLPEGLPKSNLNILNELGVAVLEYAWTSGEPHFKNIQKIVELCRQ